MNCHHVCINRGARYYPERWLRLGNASAWLPGKERGTRTETTFKSGGDKWDVSAVMYRVPSQHAEGVFVTFPAVAFAYRWHLLHTLFKAIPKSVGLGRHGEERSGFLKLKTSIRRHSVIFPFDRLGSTLPQSLTRLCCTALAAKGSGLLLPVAYRWWHKSDPSGKSF